MNHTDPTLACQIGSPADIVITANRDEPAFGGLWKANGRLAGLVRALLLKAEFADLLLFPYITVFIRQYLWGIADQGVAWALAIILSSVIWGLHARAREEFKSSSSMSFWLVVALPLLLIYAMRAPFPDMSFDVMNYHLVHSERALSGFPFVPGDFFPTVLQVNPAPNMVSGLFRHALGYRLGTLVNYLALLWVALIVDRFLRAYIKHHWLRCAAVLLVVSTELILYLLNFYLVDLLALPLLMEATYLALRFGEVKNKNYTLVHIALFLGISTAFKLTNLVVAVPVTLLCAYQAMPFWKKLDARYLLLAAAAFVAPLVPFSLYMYWQTGNPVFPFYNKIFKSPYSIANNFEDPGHGPKTLWETVLWPFWVLFYPERLSEWSGLSAAYTGRITLAYVVSLLCIFHRSLGKEIRRLGILTFAGVVLWSMTSGNGRYGLYLELLGAILAISLLASLRASAAATAHETAEAQPGRSSNVTLLLLLFGGLLAFQSVVAYRHVYRNDQAVFDEKKHLTFAAKVNEYAQEARNLFRDRSAAVYLSASEKQTLDGVDVWINSYYTTSGVEVMLKSDIPMLSVSDYISHFDFLETEESKQRFADALAYSQGKRMFSLCNAPDAKKAVKYITRTGLTVGKIVPFELFYYSQQTRLKKLLLIEVLPPGIGKGRDEVELPKLAAAETREK
ncbi:MAG TPA: hypothetical protein VF708_04185 [Pyrinomonadaceae bacterium]|jgi:hypothetical protein